MIRKIFRPSVETARLLTSNISGKPMLFFTDYEAGHGIGDAKQKYLESLAELLAFGLWQTGHPNFQLKK